MVVFMTIALISMGVLVAYFEMQEKKVAPDPRGAASDEARLLVLATTAPASVVLDQEVLDGMPRLHAALDEARATGSATIADPAAIDAIWFQLADAYGVTPREPVVVDHDGAHYSVQMVD